MSDIRTRFPWSIASALGIWFFGLCMAFAAFTLIQKLSSHEATVVGASINALSYFVGHALAITFVVYMFRRKGLSFFAQISLNLKSLNGDFNRASRMACLTFLGLLAFHAIVQFLLPVPQSQSMSPVRETALTYHGVAFLIFASMGVIAGPIMEEVLDRGFLFNACRAGFRNEFWQRLLPGELLPDCAAILLSAALFAATHLSLTGFFEIFVMGIAAAALYRYSGSLIPPMILHFLLNFVAFMQTLTTLPQ